MTPGKEKTGGWKQTERLETRISLLCIKVEFGSDRFSQILPSCHSTAVFILAIFEPHGKDSSCHERDKNEKKRNGDAELSSLETTAVLDPLGPTG